MNLNPNTIKIAIATAVGFVGFVASLVVVAGLFGGGWVGDVLALAAFVVVFVIAYLIQGRQAVTPPPEMEQGSGTPAPVPDEGGLRSEEDVAEPGLACDPGPHSVDGGEMLWLELDVRKGDRVRGRLTETSGQGFDWYIVDEQGLVAAQNGGEFDYQVGAEGVTSDTVRWTVRRKGPWYLLIDLYRRSNPREVETSLRIL